MNKYLIVNVDGLESNEAEKILKFVKADNKRDALEKYIVDNWKKGGFFTRCKRDRDFSDWSRHIYTETDDREKMKEIMLRSLIGDHGKKIGKELFNYYHFLWEFNEDKEEEHMVYPTVEQDYKISDKAVIAFFKEEIDDILNWEFHYARTEIVLVDELDLIK